jgi:Tfp pilus assembly protein PilP
MKLMTGILTAAMMTGGVWAQNPNIINNVKDKLDAVQQQKTEDSNAALGITQESPAPQQTAKPAAGSPAPAVKPAPIPSAKPVASKPAASAPKPVIAAAPKPAPATVAASSANHNPNHGSNNRLEKVNVVRHADDVQIEISPRESVTPRVSKLSSPARVVVELPATELATAQNKISVGSAGVKGVRIGMDGKTPPTTSVVVDLDQAESYDLTPGPGNTLVLTLHAQALAKNSPAPVPARIAAAKIAAAKTAAPTPKSQTAAVPVQNSPMAQKSAMVPPPASKSVKASAAPVSAPSASAAPKKVVASVAPSKPVGKAAASAPTTITAQEKSLSSIKAVEAPKPPKQEEKKKWAMNGKRDPFFSPVVQQNAGSGCSTGKKCLDIGQINLRGVVKAEAGFIAVVTNSLNKAYFLHENDPVFNGYVVRITGDSVVFQETVQDKLGKSLTREVTKKITTPAV